MPDAGPDDDFFLLGGDSISSIGVAGRARAAGLELTPRDVFEHRTPPPSPWPPAPARRPWTAPGPSARS
uniref:phosphopantetheine-binding protein n=1 Tax=Actinacidiphila glaucinigra TaxID=235986 RepID=UPI003D8BA0DF